MSIFDNSKTHRVLKNKLPIEVTFAQFLQHGKVTGFIELLITLYFIFLLIQTCLLFKINCVNILIMYMLCLNAALNTCQFTVEKISTN